MKPKPFDFLILFSILFLGLFFTIKSFSKKGNSVIVDANGIQYEYSLKKDGIYKVEGTLGATTFEIKNGSVHILDSACPNKTCVFQGWANQIVCLPNKVSIKIKNNEEFDAISQ